MSTKKGRERITITLSSDLCEIIRKKSKVENSSPGEIVEKIIRTFLYNGGKSK